MSAELTISAIASRVSSTSAAPARVRPGSQLSKSSTIMSREKAGKQLPIDYMGPGFGGRAHRVKSAGHDLARPIKAIGQIIAGEIRGTVWQADGATRVAVGGKFRQVDTWAEAALRLAQHLLADVITPMNLPIPGMSFLYGSDSKALHVQRTRSRQRTEHETVT